MLAYLGWRVVLWAYTGLSYIDVFQGACANRRQQRVPELSAVAVSASYARLHVPRSEVGMEAKFVEAGLTLALNCTLGVSSAVAPVAVACDGMGAPLGTFG